MRFSEVTPKLLITDVLSGLAKFYSTCYSGKTDKAIFVFAQSAIDENPRVRWIEALIHRDGAVVWE